MEIIPNVLSIMSFTPVGAQGGFLKKTTFPTEFCNEIYTIYVPAKKITILQKKKKKIKNKK